MEERFKYRGLYMVLSVIIAIVLWAYVGNVANPEESGTVRNLPISFAGLETLEARGLMITRGADQTVSIRVSGKRNAFRALDTETVNIIVNVSNIQQPGDYTLSYQVSYDLPNNISASSLVTMERYPSNVSFTVSRQSVRQIPVQGKLTGSVAEGYQAGTFTFYPDTVEVRGEESVVNQIKCAQVELDAQDMTETFAGELPFTFYNYATDDPVDNRGLETNVSLIQTSLPIIRLKEVELTANILPGGGADRDDVEVSVSPGSIMVSGPADALETLKSISLGNIDLAMVMENDTLIFPIPLAAELSNVSGVTEATVEIKLKEHLATAVVETDNIEWINCPDGYTAQTVTQLCQIRLRGNKGAVEAVTGEQVRVVADLSNAAAIKGTQTVPAKVYVDSSSDVGVLGEYSVVISINQE